MTARKVGRIIMIAVAALLALVVVLLGVLLAASPGTIAPVVGTDGKPAPNGVAEKTFVTIGGVKQGMIIKSRDVRNPVLLYLHGGMPDYFLNQDYPTGLEQDFTVVWWEQRGSGLSFSADIPAESMTPEQLVSDTIEVTNYLRKRFGQDKIYLMGHSGGTFVGIQTVARAPELYRSYIAVAQMTHQLESEQLAHEYMLARVPADR